MTSQLSKYEKSLKKKEQISEVLEFSTLFDLERKMVGYKPNIQQESISSKDRFIFIKGKFVNRSIDTPLYDKIKHIGLYSDHDV